MREIIEQAFRAPSEPPASRERLFVQVGIVLASTLLLLGRQTGRSPLDSLWAEDGAVFLARAVEGSSLLAVIEPYQGYIHFAPRMLASIASWFPLQAAPLVLSGGAALTVALLGVFIYRVSASYIAADWLRLVLALSPALVPVGSAEAYNNAANLHWYLMYAAFWALLWAPERFGDRLVASVIVLVAALSDPLTAMLAPLVVLRMVLRPRRDHLVTLAFAAGLAVQGAVILTADHEREFPVSASPLDIGIWYATRVLTASVFGERLAVLDGSIGSYAVLVLTAAIVAGLVVLAWRLSPDHRVKLVWLAVGSSVLLYVAPTMLTGLATPRYAVAPALLLAVGIVGLLDAGLERTHRQGPLATIGAVWIVLWLISYPAVNERSTGPSWTVEVAEARAHCAGEEPSATVTIPISPNDWDFVAACRDVVP